MAAVRRNAVLPPALLFSLPIDLHCVRHPAFAPSAHQWFEAWQRPCRPVLLSPVAGSLPTRR